MTEGNKITANEGYVLRRISDGFIYGNEVHLGYTHYLGGVLLPEPLLELPEHFEEVINKAPYWELSDEDFNARVENGEIVFNEAAQQWEEPVIEQ